MQSVFMLGVIMLSVVMRNVMTQDWTTNSLKRVKAADVAQDLICILWLSRSVWPEDYFFKVAKTVADANLFIQAHFKSPKYLPQITF